MRARRLASIRFGKAAIAAAVVAWIATSHVVFAVDGVEIEKLSPALHRGVLRAFGPEKAVRFFDNWTNEDVRAVQDKLSTHQKLAIEYITNPEHPEGELPRSFALNLFGPLAEVMGLAQFRKECPEGFHVIGDEERIRPDVAALRRPDGLMIRIDSSNHRVQVAGILESKVSLNNSESFDARQYSEMLSQWKTHGLFVEGQQFLPHEIEVQVGDRFISVPNLNIRDFFLAIYLYQPRSKTAPQGLKKLLVAEFDGWAIRYAGFSVASLGAYPFLPDRFESYQDDMRRLSSELHADSDGLTDVARIILSRYSEERLMAAFSVLSPSQIERVKLARRKSRLGPRESLIAQTPKYAVAEYEEWKSGRRQVTDPLRLVQLRLKFDSNSLFLEFLKQKQRWPENVDLTQATTENAIDLMIESRFYEAVKRFGGRSLYFFLTLSLKMQKQFLSHTEWRPSLDELNSAPNRNASAPEIWRPRWQLLEQAGFLKSNCEQSLRAL